ncbi:MAG: hypothetical protein M3R24_41530 [Chloroflexota bacterium]|nr:hypothetical protein [Chloroflexota bacterium]
MSIHLIPALADTDKLNRQVRRSLRAPSGAIHANGTHQPPTALEWTPDLTTAEQATLADVVTAANTALDLDPGDVAKVQPEIAALKNYLATTSPTTAQTTAALKAAIRVVLAFVRQ